MAEIRGAGRRAPRRTRGRWQAAAAQRTCAVVADMRETQPGAPVLPKRCASGGPVASRPGMYGGSRETRHAHATDGVATRDATADRAPALTSFSSTTMPDKPILTRAEIAEWLGITRSQVQRLPLPSLPVTPREDRTRQSHRVPREAVIRYLAGDVSEGPTFPTRRKSRRRS